MIEFDFGEHGGGQRSFKDVDEFTKFCRSQAAEWSDEPAFRKFMQIRTDAPANALRSLESSWIGLADQPQVHHPAQSLVTHLAQRIADSTLIARSSSAGMLVSEFVESQNRHRMLGAIRFYIPANKQDLFAEGDREIHLGTLSAWARTQGLDPLAAAKSRDSLRRTVNELRGHEKELLASFEAAGESVKEKLAELTLTGTEQSEAFAEKLEKAGQAIAQDRETWAAKWKELYDLHVEQLKMRAPVELWTSRAEEHERKAKGAQTWTLRVGAIGLLGAIAWSVSSLYLASLFFTEGQVVGAVEPVPGTLRPTWIHELVFAASSTLLYLTLYLWALRILVRSMLSEQHLAADARSRASMAHTYLALTESHAAEESDRAIVLASLFRPVTDGLVKDDALPLISPASILSDRLTGK